MKARLTTGRRVQGQAGQVIKGQVSALAEAENCCLNYLPRRFPHRSDRPCNLAQCIQMFGAPRQMFGARLRTDPKSSEHLPSIGRRPGRQENVLLPGPSLIRSPFPTGPPKATVMSCGCSFVTSLTLLWLTHPLKGGDDPLLRENPTLTDATHHRLR